jgi:predicted RNA-binding protein with PUA-like domain
MATKKVEGQEEDFIATMNEVELAEIQKKIDERWKEIRLEKSKEILDKIKLGNFILYSKNGYDKLCGIVEIITKDFIGIKKYGDESKMNHRKVSYEEIEGVSDKIEDGWIVEV